MTVLGLTLLTTRLTGLAFITYWLACGALVLLALGTAALDMLVMSARGREERQQLAREADPGTPGTERAAAVQQAAEE